MKTNYMKIEIEYPGSEDLIIFLQGSWCRWNSTKNINAAEALHDNGISVLLYEPRKNRAALWKAKTDDEWIAASDGRTFDDEVEDFREFVSWANEKYKPKRLFISGHSMGAGISAIVAGDGIVNLSKVLLACPQIVSPYEQDAPNIYQGFFDEEVFKKAISKFIGELKLVRTSDDGRDGLYQCLELKKGAVNAVHNDILLINCDHSFVKYGLEEYVKAHVDFFCD